MDDIAELRAADLVDRPAEVTIATSTTLATSFIRFERHALRLRGLAGQDVAYDRDLVRIGRVAAVLPLDPRRREIVMFRQFRLGAHMALGRGELIEIVAGLVDAGETPAMSAARECVEEIGVAAKELIELFSFMPAPGFTDEHATLFLGTIDASEVPARAGLAEESEELQPFRVSVDEAVAALASGRIRNGYTLHALQWLAINRDGLDGIIRRGAVRDA